MRSLFLISLILFSCSYEDEEKEKEKEHKPAPLPLLAQDPPSVPKTRKRCLPLPQGWPNPWPCLPKPSPLDPAPTSLFGTALNKERKAKTLPLLFEDKKIVCAASKHALAISKSKNCSHLNGSSFVERLTECGFVVNGGAEVIACGHHSAQEALDDLLQSPKHRAILLDPKAKRLGVVQINNYWVVVASPQ